MNKVRILTDKENIKLNDVIIRSFKKKAYKEVTIKVNNSTNLELEVVEDVPLYYSILSDLISNYIVENIEKDIIKEVVYDECYGLPNTYVDEVLGKVQWEILYKDENNLKTNRKIDLNNEVNKILQKEGNFSLPGFMRFRFKSRFVELVDSAYSILDETLNEQGIEDFTTLVKKLIRVQPPKIESIHITSLKDGKFEIVTSDNDNINLDELAQSLEKSNSDLEYEITIHELIISTLLSTLPQKVYMHTNENFDNKLFSIVKKIYDGRCTENNEIHIYNKKDDLNNQE